MQTLGPPPPPGGPPPGGKPHGGPAPKGGKPRAQAEPPEQVMTASQGGTLQQSPGGPGGTKGPGYADGEKLFMMKGCVGCHSLQAVNAPKGMVGPNLANVGARSYIGAGSFKNTDETLARWIQNPQAMKKGVLMPNLGVKPEEAKSLVAFLRAHQ